MDKIDEEMSEQEVDNLQRSIQKKKVATQISQEPNKITRQTTQNFIPISTKEKTRLYAHMKLAIHCIRGVKDLLGIPDRRRGIISMNHFFGQKKIM
ncbi:hypothetical protein KY285_020978 [Solanum tuberosum]|nr:hypothetical protein KY284_025267 [Solanum tuberosum]KAH0677176.1 hypothetical protein KY285_024977 [Solanum tuberosum]KAH0679968.1 hypothetical protein KY284_021053 [Solanum tuberosum]KAH0693881.1 hypothetical protein KY285_020978 [Solanum tuberosum]